MNLRALIPLFLALMLPALPAAAQLASMPDASNAIRPAGSSGSISGTVTGADSQPIRDCRIELNDVSTGRSVAAAYTLPNGSFELQNIPAGRYELVATRGLDEVRHQVDVDGISAPLTIRLKGSAAESGGGPTVSVAQLKIPDKARKHLEKAQHLVNKNKLQDARKEIDQALKVAPKFAAALTLRGVLEMQAGKAADAIPDLQAAVEADPNYAMGQVVLGSAYNMLSRFDDAIRELSRAETIAPAAWQLHFELSKALLGKGDFDKAMRQAGQAVSLNPKDYAPVHLVMAHACLGLKMYDQAVAQLEQYLAKSPNGADSAHARQMLDQVKAFVARK